MLLREKDKQRLLAIFSNVDYPMEVWAYGSRVNGRAHSGSDLDLVVRGEGQEPIPSGLLKKLQADIEDSNIPILVDLRDWNKIPESFRKGIDSNFVILYSNLVAV